MVILRNCQLDINKIIEENKQLITAENKKMLFSCSNSLKRAKGNKTNVYNAKTVVLDTNQRLRLNIKKKLSY